MSILEFTPLFITLPLVGFWFWMFRDMTINEYLTSKEKTNWLLAFVFLNIFGAAYYYLVEYRNRNL